MNDLDLLDEPSVEEAHPEATLDLDDLLAESVTIANARKEVKRSSGGRRQVDPALLNIAQAAEAALVWEPECAVARFVETHCTCGSSHRSFDGWFIVSTHRRDPGARRFLRSEDHHSLPSWQYTATAEVLFCSDCVEASDLPHATIDLLTGIDALGSPAGFSYLNLDQISLMLEEAEDKAIDEGDADLADYDEGDLT